MKGRYRIMNYDERMSRLETKMNRVVNQLNMRDKSLFLKMYIDNNKKSYTTQTVFRDGNLITTSER